MLTLATNKITVIISLVMAANVLIHDAKLDYVAEAAKKHAPSVNSDVEESVAEDSSRLTSSGRHIHVEKTSLPELLSNQNTQSASSQPLNRKNEKKYIAQNRLVCNTYGNNTV